MVGWNNIGRRKIAERHIEDFARILKQSYIEDSVELSLSVFKTNERLPLKKTLDLERTPIRVGDEWGSCWSSGYFYISADIPKSLKGKNLVLRINLGGEVLLYDKDCNAIFGLTNCSIHKDVYFKDLYVLGRYIDDKFEIYAEAASNDLLGMKRNEKKVSRNMQNPHGVWHSKIEYASIGVFTEDNWRLSMAVDYLFSLYSSLGSKQTRAVRILSALLDAANTFSVKGAIEAFKCIEKVLSIRANDSALTNIVVGHAHIDSAWLWPIAESHRKVARTFSSQIKNIDRYPNYIFAASSPQQYKWIRDEYPSLFKEMKKKISEKKWEAIGAMWIEPDCILTSGESLVRQIIEGKKFYKCEFGINVNNAWLPDCFGFPASLPQILKKSGIDNFLTQKISWNAHTEFPYTTFIWEGIDGSEVLTHFLPEKTYNSDGYPSDYKKAEDNFLEKDRLDEFVTALGIGDGGGGPKYEHIELTNLASDSECVPKSRFGFISDFFNRLNKKKDLLEKYKGELYLELHRGTYTSQAITKRNNVLFEEGLAAIEAILSEEEYSKKFVEEIIQDGLLLQFHDILPGSCIGEVYREADEMYSSIFERLFFLLSEYASKNFSEWSLISSKFGQVKNNKNNLKTISVFSYRGSKRLSLVSIDGLLSDSYNIGNEYKLNKLGTSFYGFLPLHAGWTSFAVNENEIVDIESSSLLLSNRFIKYQFNENGQIISTFDSQGKEYITSSYGNNLRMYVDQPQAWEAWDIDYYYKDMEIDSFKKINHKKIDDNILEFEFLTDKSIIKQYVLLSPDGPELYFVNEVSWNEERKFLRVEFPTRKLDYATSAIAYGTLKRKTNIQNEEDFAKFEIPAQGFIDVSDEQGGSALISDVKYGFSIYDEKLGLSLLRSPIDPDPYADLGNHKFVYCYAPHSCRFEESDVKEISETLKSVNVTIASECGYDCQLPISIDGNGICTTAVRKMDTGDSLLIRCHENLGKQGKATLSCPIDKSFRLATLDERIVDDIIFRNGDVIYFDAFEIKTFIEA